MKDLRLFGILCSPYQVDEISDIGAPLRERYHERGAGISRCLKLCMTDGVQRVFGIEYRPIAALQNLFPAGIKVGGPSFLAIFLIMLELPPSYRCGHI